MEQKLRRSCGTAGRIISQPWEYACWSVIIIIIIIVIIIGVAIPGDRNVVKKEAENISNTKTLQ
jgi:hypothetical protein